MNKITGINHVGRRVTYLAIVGKFFLVFVLNSIPSISLAQLGNEAVIADFDGSVLTVPAIRTGNDYVAAEFSVSDSNSPLLEVISIENLATSISDPQIATLENDVLTIPCLRANSSYFQVTARLSQQEPTVQFDSVSASPVTVCESDSVGHLTFMSPHSNPIVLNASNVYTANTPSATVDVIDSVSNSVIKRIPVGIDPVALAVRPDGKEIWVSNHVSDTVSVIDTDPLSRTYHQVIATIQNLDDTTKSTFFDEPVGIAFAGDDKAYVALSSLDRIAIVDVESRTVSGHIPITAQDPRAIAVEGERLYVTAFESNNRTELSGCFGTIDGDQCTFSLQQHVVSNNNVLSLGYDADIVKDPRVPDRDLFVFDTTSNALLETVSSVGTLLYGVTVDSTGKVFVAQTDARNDANGRAGTLKHTLADMENRAFLNQIAVVDCATSCGIPSSVELEPLPPINPDPGMALATPFAITISPDDATLVVTAAGSDQLFTVNADNGEVLGRVAVDAVPRGIALQSDDQGKPIQAWVLNVVANTVSVVDLSELDAPSVTSTVVLEDPTES